MNYMYLDSKGNVTVAVGQMLASVQAALDLPFMKRGMGQDFPASAGEISDDYNRVKTASIGHGAHFYHSGVSVYLEDGAMDDMLRTYLDKLDKSLRAHFPRFDAWPDPAKLAYLDMGYNLGYTRLIAEYPRMNAAAAGGQWLQCAAECTRDPRDPAFERRNAWTRQQFRDAWVKRSAAA